MDNQLALVLVLAPFLGFLCNVFFGKSLGKTASGWIGTLAVVVSFMATISFFMQVNGSGKAINVRLFEWMQVGNFKLDIGFLLDQLSLLWLLFVLKI